MKRSKFDALEMSIDGLDVDCVSLAVAHAIATGLEELVEHVVLVGGEDQLVDRQPHLPRDVAREDVAEIARRHRKADLLAVVAVAAK